MIPRSDSPATVGQKLTLARAYREEFMQRKKLNPRAYPLVLFGICFLLAAIGAALGLSLGENYRRGNLLAYIAFGMAATGVAIGYAAVIWGVISMVAGAKGRAEARRALLEEQRKEVLWKHNFTQDP